MGFAAGALSPHLGRLRAVNPRTVSELALRSELFLRNPAILRTGKDADEQHDAMWLAERVACSALYSMPCVLVEIGRATSHSKSTCMSALVKRCLTKSA